MWTTTRSTTAAAHKMTDPVSGRYITLTYGISPGAGSEPCPTNGTSTRPRRPACCARSTTPSSAAATKLYYNSSGQLARIEDPGSELTDFHYNYHGLIDWIKDPLGMDMIAAGKRPMTAPPKPTSPTRRRTTRTIRCGHRVSPHRRRRTVPRVRNTRTLHVVSARGSADVHVAGATEPNGWSRRVTYATAQTDDSRRLLTDIDAATSATSYSYNNLADAVRATTDPAGFMTTHDLRQSATPHRPNTGHRRRTVSTARGVPKTSLPGGCSTGAELDHELRRKHQGPRRDLLEQPQPRWPTESGHDRGRPILGTTQPRTGAPRHPNPDVPANGWSARYSGDITFDRPATISSAPTPPTTPASARPSMGGHSSHNGSHRTDQKSSRRSRTTKICSSAAPTTRCGTSPGTRARTHNGRTGTAWVGSSRRIPAPVFAVPRVPSTCSSAGLTARSGKVFDNAGWHDWISIGGSIEGAPDCASWDLTHVTVGARGAADHLCTRAWTGAGSGAAGPAAAALLPAAHPWLRGAGPNRCPSRRNRQFASTHLPHRIGLVCLGEPRWHHRR